MRSAALVCAAVLTLLPLIGAAGTATSSAPAQTERYTRRHVHDPNGIGKFYMGREIAHVMGHEAADWLERPERENEESPDQMLRHLRLRPGDVVADIGAGSGYLTTRIARIVHQGRVKAVDIQPEMLDLLRQKVDKLGITNVDLVLGKEDDPQLPPSAVDLALFVDVYHELEYPFEMMQRIRQSLRPGGRVVLVEFRLEDPKVPIKLVHKMSEAQAIREMRAAGFRHLESIETLPWQHIFIFTPQQATTTSAAAG